MNLRRRYPARAYELLGPGHVKAEGIRVDHGPARGVVRVVAPAADPDVSTRQRRRAVDLERRGRGRMVHDPLRRGKVTVPDDYVALLEAHQALVVAVVDVVDERRRVEKPRLEPRRDRGAARVRDVALEGAAADVGALRRAAGRARGKYRAAPPGPLRVAVVQVRAHGLVVQEGRVGQV